MQPPVLLQSAVFFLFCFFLSVTFWNTAQRAVIHTLFLAHFFSSRPLLPFTVIKLMMVCHVSWSGLFTAQIYGPVIPQSDMVTTVNLVTIWIKTTTPGWFFPGPGFSLWRDLGAARSSTKRLNIKRLGYFLLEWTVLEPLWTFDLTTSFKINLGNGVIVVAGGFWRVGNREPLFPVAPRFSTRPQ